MQKDKILSYLGFATRARKAVSGEFSVEKSIKQRKAKLVIVSEEASDRIRERNSRTCVNSERFPCTFSVREKNWGAHAEKISVFQWLLKTKD